MTSICSAGKRKEIVFSLDVLHTIGIWIITPIYMPGRKKHFFLSNLIGVFLSSCHHPLIFFGFSLSTLPGNLCADNFVLLKSVAQNKQQFWFLTHKEKPRKRLNVDKQFLSRYQNEKYGEKESALISLENRRTQKQFDNALHNIHKHQKQFKQFAWFHTSLFLFEMIPEQIFI